MVRHTQIPPRIHPYVAVDPGGNPEELKKNASIRRLLRDRAIDSAASLARRITEEGQVGAPVASLPPLLASVDRATDGLASRRIANMLDAFVYFVNNSESAFFCSRESGALFNPRAIRRSGSQPSLYLTSPALLVIQAILFSHAAWFRPRHHEAHSAFLAYSVLGGQEYLLPLDERDLRFVAGLITHQTLLRVAWQLHRENHPREVCAYTKDCLTENFPKNDDATATDELLAQAIGRTLFEFLKLPEDGAEAWEREELSEALVLLSLCLQCRHLRHPKGGLPDERLGAQRVQILEFSKLLAKSSETPPTAPSGLVFFQFGRYVMRAEKPNVWEEFRGGVQERIKGKMADQASSPPAFNVTICFDRLADSIGELQQLELFTIGLDSAGPQETTVKAIEAAVGWTVDVDSPAGRLDRQLRATLSRPVRQEAAKPTDPEELAALLQRWETSDSGFFPLYRTLEERARGTSDEEARDAAYYPAPLVGRLLSLLSHARPEGFSTLRLRPRRLQTEPDEQLLRRPLTIPLPRIDPESLPKASKTDSSPNESSEEEICARIARYVAAMVMNLEVSLGPQRIDLDFFSDRSREFWSQRVDKALEENDNKAFLDYLDMVHAERCAVATDATTIRSVRPSLVLPYCYELPGKRVLGIDVGGTRVKCALYELICRAGQKPELASLLREHEIETEPSTGCYRDASYFARHVARALTEAESPTGAPPWFEDLLAAGIAWPGAVHGDGTIAGPSGTIAKFARYDRWPQKRVNPHSLHELDILGAFEEELKMRAGQAGSRAGPPTVLVLNDGDADVCSDEEVLAAQSRADIVSLVLKAGTGTACGLYVGTRQVPLLAEAGKMVLDLGRDGWPGERNGYPRGLLNLHCSAKTLPVIACALRWTLKDAHGDALKDDRGNLVLFQSHEIGFFLEQRDPEADKQLAGGIAEERIEALRAAAEPTGESAEGLAARCARIAGDRLGDAIAMLVTVFRCSEIRLGGGVLSGATGELVTNQARERLERVYSYDVTDQRTSGGAVLDAHALAEIRKIAVIPPAAVGDHRGPAGARGAAKAALESAVQQLKSEKLRSVRSWLHDLPFRETPSSEAIDLDKLAQEHPPLVEEDVRAMIDANMATLGITRAPSGEYYKFHPRFGQIGGTGKGYFPESADG